MTPGRPSSRKMDRAYRRWRAVLAERLGSRSMLGWPWPGRGRRRRVRRVSFKRRFVMPSASRQTATETTEVEGYEVDSAAPPQRRLHGRRRDLQGRHRPDDRSADCPTTAVSARTGASSCRARSSSASPITTRPTRPGTPTTPAGHVSLYSGAQIVEFSPAEASKPRRGRQRTWRPPKIMPAVGAEAQAQLARV